MIIILLKRAFKKPVPSKIKLTTGIISMILGLMASYTIFTYHNLSVLGKIGFHILPLWIILFGLRDILVYKNNFRPEKDIVIASE
jgi:hypothetical protein